MGDMQLSALHMDMILDGFSRCQLMPGNAFDFHTCLPIRFQQSIMQVRAPQAPRGDKKRKVFPGNALVNKNWTRQENK